MRNACWNLNHGTSDSPWKLRSKKVPVVVSTVSSNDIVVPWLLSLVLMRARRREVAPGLLDSNTVTVSSVAWVCVSVGEGRL